MGKRSRLAQLPSGGVARGARDAPQLPLESNSQGIQPKKQLAISTLHGCKVVFRSHGDVGKHVVVIPALVSGDADVRRLRAAVHSVFPHPVIVVDDGSKPPIKIECLRHSPLPEDGKDPGATSPRDKPAATRRELQVVHLLRNCKNLGPGAARNSGWVAAQSLGASIVLFMDADCQGSPAWVREMVALHASRDPCIIGGITKAIGTDWISRFHDQMGTLNPRILSMNKELVQAQDKHTKKHSNAGSGHDPEGRSNQKTKAEAETEAANQLQNEAAGPHQAMRDQAPQGHATTDNLQKALYVPTCNMSVHVDALRLLEGFNESFPRAAFEDVEMCVRARKEKVPVLVAPFSRCPPMHHAFDATVPGFCSQFLRYGASHPQMLEIHPEYDDWYASSEEIPAGDATLAQSVETLQGCKEKAA